MKNNKRKKIYMTIAIILACLIAILFYCTRAPRRKITENGTRIKLTTGETVLHATLNDTVTAEAFANQLPKSYTVSVSSVDMCGGAPDLPSDSKENQTGWHIGDIDYGDGWFMIFQSRNLNIPFMRMPVIGSIDKDDIEALQALSGSVTFTVELEADSKSPYEGETTMEERSETDESDMITLTVNGHSLTAKLEDNSSAQSLKELLKKGPLTIDMRDYASMEKVGDIGQELPTNNEQIVTEAGDLILYQGRAFVIYYDANSWNFTRLGKIQDVTKEELKEILGNGDVTVTIENK